MDNFLAINLVIIYYIYMWRRSERILMVLPDPGIGLIASALKERFNPSGIITDVVEYGREAGKYLAILYIEDKARGTSQVEGVPVL